MKFLFFYFFFLTLYLQAESLKTSHQEGMVFARSLKESVPHQPQSINKADVPGYQTDHPFEMNLDQNGLKDAADQRKQGDESFLYLQKNSMDPNRKKYAIESENLLLNAENAIANPIKTMNEMVMEEQGSDSSKEELFACEESGEPYFLTCSKRLEVDVKVTPEIKEFFCESHRLNLTYLVNLNLWKLSHINGGRHYGDFFINHRFWPSGPRHDWTFGYFNPQQNTVNSGSTFCMFYCEPGCQTRILQHKSVEIVREVWVDNCADLEGLVERGICTYGQKEIGGPETRTIQGEIITQPSWFERYTYICKKQPETSCESVKAKRCSQVDSKCLESINGLCVLWRYTYRCLSPSLKKMKTYKSSDSSPFCFTGNCADSSYAVNTDMMDAFSQLAILKQVESDNKKNVGIFKGDGLHCTRDCANFQDCCKTDSGWGVDIGLTHCSENEKLLSKLRDKKQCVLVGTYCTARFLGVCTRKKTGFCCFGSKLSKTIQEQGRRQLGIGWGQAEHPDCRALTSEELSRLDFTKMDLTPLYEDIHQKMKIPDQSHMAKGVELDRIRENMKSLTNNQTRIGS